MNQLTQDLVDMLITCRDRFMTPTYGCDWPDAARDVERCLYNRGIPYPKNKHLDALDCEGVKDE